MSNYRISLSFPLCGFKVFSFHFHLCCNKIRFAFSGVYYAIFFVSLHQHHRIFIFNQYRFADSLFCFIFNEVSRMLMWNIAAMIYHQHQAISTSIRRRKVRHCFAVFLIPSRLINHTKGMREYLMDRDENAKEKKAHMALGVRSLPLRRGDDNKDWRLRKHRSIYNFYESSNFAHVIHESLLKALSAIKFNAPGSWWSSTNLFTKQLVAQSISIDQ